jgi:GT2 family glycosyltransferase
MNESAIYRPGQPISVVLFCHNKAACLPFVVAALAKGIVKPDLVVLSDDRSSDDSVERFSQLCKIHSLRHTAVLHPDAGVVLRLNTLRNDGVAACPDGLVMLLDADLVLARSGLQRHLELHVEHTVPIISTGPRLEYARADCTGPVNFMWGFEGVGHVSSPAFGAFPQLPNWQVTSGSLMALTRRAVEDVGWFDTRYDGNYGFDDVDFTYRAERAGYRFVGDWEAHAIHIPHAATLNRDNTVNRQKFIEKYGFDLVYPPAIVGMCRRSWSEYYLELAGTSAPSSRM